MERRQFDSGTVYGVLKNNSIIIENFHFQSDEDFFAAFWYF